MTFIQNVDYEKFDDFVRNHSVKSHFMQSPRKERGIEVSPDSIFDVQVKRLHEYKRQQLNLLCAIDMYYRIKAGNKPERPDSSIRLS